MWKAASTAALILAAALVAGCGGSSAKSPAAGDTTTSAARPAANTNLAALLNNLGKRSFKVTFTDASDNTQTYAQDGKGNTVTINGDVQTYTTPTAAITCEKGDAGTFTCTQAPANYGANSTYIAFALAERTYATALAYRLAHTSAKTIAGLDASCFSVSAPDFRGVKGVAGAAGARLSGVAAYCNGRDTGALLESTITDDSGEMTTNVLVTKVEEPSAADFQPPAPPTIVTIPGGPVTVPGGVGAQ